MNLASIKTRKNPEKNQFELKLDEATAIIAYKVAKTGAVYLVHTEVPDGFEGQGVGHKLVRETLEILEKEQLKIIPLCPFVRSFIEDHFTDYEQILAEGVKL